MRLSGHTPHLDEDWVEAFVVELRARDVPGTRIGAHLAELEQHCAESGEDVRSAFGDPRGYARDVIEAIGAPQASTPARFTAAVGTLLGFAGLVVTPTAVDAVRRGKSFDVSWGALAGWALLAVVVALVVQFSGQVLSWVARHWLSAALVCFLVVPLQVWLLVVARAPAFTLPAAPVLAAGCAFLAAGLMWDLRHPLPDDAIRGPRELGGVGSVPVGRGLRAVASFTPYLFIALTVLMVLMVLMGLVSLTSSAVGG